MNYHWITGEDFSHTGNSVASGDTDFPPEYCECGYECVPGEYKCAICIEDSEKDKPQEEL